MQVTVTELIDRCPPGIEVLVEDGLDRPIRWVHPTELADPSDYLEGGEIILTAGVWMDGGTRPGAMVSRLSDAGVTAIGYGLTKKSLAVPAAMIKACRRHGIGLFSVPLEVPFLAIMSEFVELVSKEREAPLQQAIRRNEQFLRASLQSDPARALIETISRYCDSGSYLIDALGELLAASGAPPDRDELERVRSRLPATTDLGPRRVFAIPPGDTPEGWLVMTSMADPPEPEQAVVEQAIPFLTLAFARRRSLSESQRRFAAELVDLLLAGASMAPVAKARIEAFRLSLAKGLFAVVVRRAGSDEPVLEILEHSYREHGFRATVTTKRDEIVSVVQANGDEAAFQTFLDLVCAKLQERGHEPVAMGYGQTARDVAGLRKSLIEAQHACLLATYREGGGHASYAQIGSHQFLIALQEQEVLAQLGQAVLAPLEEHDARSQVSLVETLDVFLNSGAKWQETAKTLFIHVNTLRHRLNNVEQLTGRDLSSMSDRVDFFIALRSRERESATA